MTFTSTIHAKASRDALRASLGESLREWRESAIAPDLAEKGIYRVVGSMQQDSFSLELSRRSRPFINPVLTGRIIASNSDQSDVVVRCAHRDHRALGGMAILGALGLWNAFTSSIWLAMALIGAAGVWGGIYWFQNASIDPKMSEAHLLVSRLRSAIDHAESSMDGSVRKPANER